MRTLHVHEARTSRQRIAQETMDIYVPLAHAARHPLDEAGARGHAFRELHPDVAEELERQLSGSREEREKYIEEVIGIDLAKLAEADGDRGRGEGAARRTSRRSTRRCRAQGIATSTRSTT